MPAFCVDVSMEPLSIVKYPHPALRWKSKPIVEIDQRLREVVRQMFALMYEAKGVGLAANQVALPWRLFVINPTGDPQEADQEFVFLNPEIIRRKGSEEGEEGCLSLPGLYSPVRRSERVSIEAFDLEGAPFRMDLDEFTARIVQHEFDHIEGTLFIDHISDDQRDEIAAELLAMEQEFRESQKSGTLPADDALTQKLRTLEPAG